MVDVANNTGRFFAKSYDTIQKNRNRMKFMENRAIVSQRYNIDFRPNFQPQPLGGINDKSVNEIDKSIKDLKPKYDTKNRPKPECDNFSNGGYKITNNGQPVGNTFKTRDETIAALNKIQSEE